MRKVWVYRIYIDLPNGRTIIRTVRIAAKDEAQRDKLFEMWYSIADRKELIEVIEPPKKQASNFAK